MEEKSEKYSTREIIKVAWRVVVFTWKNEPKRFIFNLFLHVCIAILMSLQLVSFSGIINEIIKMKELGIGITQDLIRQSIFLSLSFLLPDLLENINNYIQTAISTRIGTKINLHLIDKYAAFDIATIESEEFQKKRDRAYKWGTGSINNVRYYITNIVRQITGVIASAVILYNINPSLTFLAIIGVLPYYFIERAYGSKIFLLTYTATDESRIEGDRMSHFRDQQKIIEVLLYKLKKVFKKQIIDITDSYDSNLISISRKQSLAHILADIFQIICLLTAIAIVAQATISGAMLVGSLFLAFTSYRSFLSSTQNFFVTQARMLEQARFAKTWFDIFDIKAKIINDPNALVPDWKTSPTIEFKNVSFGYQGTNKKVLKGISFTLNPGEKFAMVGLNGAGKTTLIKLLCRIYDPEEGEILINGINLKKISIDYWHSFLGILFQDFNNYRMTVREAIAISKPDEPIDDEKVLQVAEMSGVTDFVDELPKKYDQLLWKGFQDGVELSKGQYQRMAVARILYRDALISVLDEPTSAIDAVAEEKIFEVLEKNMEGRTVVLISHRFSTVKNADQIAVIEHGELKELGSHKELMVKNGRYAELYNMQASRYLESE
ncbi:MAG: ABC transporter ATP-binding protein [Candidatus Pacebacteria bacterium]|nr:ABC transporter ATP-binding protein [Candidatus Paceibacterota bacterium]